MRSIYLQRGRRWREGRRAKEGSRGRGCKRGEWESAPAPPSPPPLPSLVWRHYPRVTVIEKPRFAGHFLGRSRKKVIWVVIVKTECGNRFLLVLPRPCSSISVLVLGSRLVVRVY